ncbi:hypothetical protein D3C83_97430 [compost metagenome]
MAITTFWLVTAVFASHTRLVTVVGERLHTTRSLGRQVMPLVLRLVALVKCGAVEVPAHPVGAPLVTA